MLTTLQKESGLLDRTDVTAAQYQAAWGWDCPDTGPGGTADCDPAHAGFVNQAYGMAAQWARYRTNPERYTYRAGETAEVLWNVRESGCGAAPVTFANTATASLYNYTPYQPNAAALAAYPGTGDECSSYGNRNFYFMFRKYFGSTGGGRIGSAPVAGTEVVVPTGPYVASTIGGRTITAPTAAVAAGLSAGFTALGMPYVWGGGGSGSGPSDGCARGGGEFNSCGTQIGFDCSGLTAFVLAQAGYSIPGNSTEQRAAGARIPWSDAEPGDIVGFPGHVAVYLGVVDGIPHLLEASWVGTPISVTTLTRSDVDPVVYRFWSGPAGSTPRDRSGIGPWITPDPAPGPDPAPRVLVPEPAPSRPPADPGSVPTAPAAEQPGPPASPPPADPPPVRPTPTPPAVPSVPIPTQPTPPAPVEPPPAPSDPSSPEVPTPPAEPGGTEPVPDPDPVEDPPAEGDRWWICPLGPLPPEAIVVDISGNSPAPMVLVRSAVAPGETSAYQGCAADPVLEDMLATVLIEHGMDTVPVADVIIVSRTDAVRLGAPTSRANP
jgi:cell wall-associated NlpC family hydrolase